MSKLVPVGAFILGCAVGVGASYKYFENKFKQIADDEIDSVKKAFATIPFPEEKLEEAKEEVKSNVLDKLSLKEEFNKARGIIEKEGYKDYSEISKPKKETKQEPVEAEELRPYIIPPEEFGMEDDYAEISLTYYADGILANEEDEVVDDVDSTIGEDSLTHFGEFEEDSVFVRDDQKKIDYEILLDTRSYADVIESKPRRVSLED